MNNKVHVKLIMVDHSPISGIPLCAMKFNNNGKWFCLGGKRIEIAFYEAKSLCKALNWSWMHYDDYFGDWPTLEFCIYDGEPMVVEQLIISPYDKRLGE